MYLPCPPRTLSQLPYPEPDGFQWFAWRHPDLDRVAAFLNLNEVKMAWANHITAEGDYVSATFMYPVINRPLAEQHTTLSFPFTVPLPGIAWSITLHRKGVKARETDKYPESGDVVISGTIPAGVYANIADFVTAANNSRPPEYQTDYTLKFVADGAVLYCYYYADLPEAVTVDLPQPGWSVVAAVDNTNYAFLDPDTVGLGGLRRDELPANWDLIEDPEA